MIANVTYGDDFSGLLEYLVEHRDHEVLDLRGVSSVELAADEMALVAAGAERTQKSVMHVSLSAAPGDGLLKLKLWLLATSRIEAEFGLADRQRVIVRHRDKDYDHVHIFWCVVGENGCAPPHRRFLAKGVEIEGMGRFALTPDQIKKLPPHQVVRGSYNRYALFRLMDLCRDLERDLKLTKVRSHKEVKKAQMAGEPRRRRDDDQHRHARTGTEPLMARADAIRLALDEQNWRRAERALAEIGIGMKPARKPTKTDPNRIRGLVLYDLLDEGNQIAASDLDIAGRKYGLRQIEKRHEEGAVPFESWWPERTGPGLPAGRSRTPAEATVQGHGAVDVTRVRENFERDRAAHRLQKLLDAAKRKELRAKHAADRKKLQRGLIEERREFAERLPRHQRRAFYAIFSRTRRASALAAQRAAQTGEMDQHRPSRFPTWREYAGARGVPSYAQPTEKTVVPRAVVTRSDDRELERPSAVEWRAYEEQRNAAPVRTGQETVAEEEVSQDVLNAFRKAQSDRGKG